MTNASTSATLSLRSGGVLPAFVPVPDLETAVQSLDLIVERLIGCDGVNADEIAVLTDDESTFAELRGRHVARLRLMTSGPATISLATVGRSQASMWDVVLLVLGSDKSRQAADHLIEAGSGLARRNSFVLAPFEMRNMLNPSLFQSN